MRPDPVALLRALEWCAGSAIASDDDAPPYSTLQWLESEDLIDVTPIHYNFGGKTLNIALTALGSYEKDRLEALRGKDRLVPRIVTVPAGATDSEIRDAQERAQKIADDYDPELSEIPVLQPIAEQVRQLDPAAWPAGSIPRDEDPED